MALPAPVRIGYFGKVPNHGDFIGRGVPRPLRQRLDTWLADALADSKARLGAGWLDAYMSAPIWRFVLRDMPESGPVAGVMIPSVDRINRHFPFVVIAEFQTMQMGADTLPALDHLLDSLEAFAMRGLGDGFDIEQFDYDLMYFQKALARNGRVPSSTNTVAEILGDDKTGTIGAMDSGHLRSAGSVFWTQGSDLRSAGMMTFQDLPPAGAFAGFLRDADIFADLEEIWLAVRDLTASRHDNGIVSIQAANVETGFAACADLRVQDPNLSNTFFCAINEAIGALAISNGRFGTERDASVGRFVSHVLAAPSQEPPEARIARLHAWLNQKFPDRTALKSEPLLGVAAILPAPGGSVDIMCSPDFACLVKSGELARWLFAVTVEDGEPTLRVNAEGLPPVQRMTSGEIDMLALVCPAPSRALLAEPLADLMSIRPQAAAAARFNQDRLLDGVNGTLAVATLKPARP